METFFGSDVALASEPVFHAPLKTIDGNAIAGFKNTVCDWKRVVEDGVVGEVAHGKAIDPLDRAEVRDTFRIDAFDV
jgi:hypothetical protein